MSAHTGSVESPEHSTPTEFRGEPLKRQSNANHTCTRQVCIPGARNVLQATVEHIRSLSEPAEHFGLFAVQTHDEFVIAVGDVQYLDVANWQHVLYLS